MGLAFVNWILGRVVDGQSMSMAGLDSDVMSASTWALGGVMGFFLAGCGLVLLLTGVRDRAPGRFGRVLLISCAITHGVLGALTVGLVGWPAFAFMMVVLGLVVLSLLAYGKPDAAGSRVQDSPPLVPGEQPPPGPPAAPASA
ncbi:hypothetical protein NLX86_12925 [Streptomyces sp. A3M-1-3]|uniref:hypothetical protein n=1 Tax=Streptomyces sp. A3M-1-3 TaxID=2962044 RepID=UPI0020B8E5F1|nr:hypothetical protein [Streptomyces sp. A3M-1-3]MCP3818983.1 hypothetical protein [Streptomyces sp. A3M-1-3]